jgi:hypothetical protein
MPFYRFEIDTTLTQQVVMERIRSLIREREAILGFFLRTRQPFNPATPFVGSAGEDSFSMQRDIRYRNSFLPRIRGKAGPGPTGTCVKVTMFLHPLVAVFVTFWLGIVGSFALLTLSSSDPFVSLGPGSMFLFGLVLTCGAFFFEAFKARRLLSAALADREMISVVPIE